MNFASTSRSEIWFEDGSVVLLADNKSFKVHRDLLSRHSDVFAGLFSVPQPTEQSLYDGLPCIQLHDPAVDILYFLRALYDGLYFETPTASDFPIISAVLRLSSKYLVEHLRARCIARMQLDWPSTLAGWDKREAAATDDAGRYLPRDICPHPILIINLAMELGLDAFLPSAFYDLSRYGPSKIMGGVVTRVAKAREDGGEESDEDNVGKQDPAVRLSMEFLTTTLRGRERSQRFVSTFITTHLSGRQPATDCLTTAATSRPCRESFYFIMLNMLRSVGGIACGRDGDPLFTLVQAIEMLDRTDFSDGTKMCGLGICASCKRDFRVDANKSREQVWRSLPAWFGLASPTATGSTTTSDDEDDDEMESDTD